MYFIMDLILKKHTVGCKITVFAVLLFGQIQSMYMKIKYLYSTGCKSMWKRGGQHLKWCFYSNDGSCKSMWKRGGQHLFWPTNIQTKGCKSMWKRGGQHQYL